MVFMIIFFLNINNFNLNQDEKLDLESQKIVINDVKLTSWGISKVTNYVVEIRKN